LGLQFFPDRPTALGEIRRVLAPGGRTGISVFGPIEHNPATHALAGALDLHIGPGASLAKRNEHVLAHTDELRTLLQAAAFQDVVIESATKTVRFPSATVYVRVQFAATPLATLVERYDPSDRDRLIRAVAEDVGLALAGYTSDAGLTFPQEVHVALASR
jgi:hypothetical protein